MNKLIISIVSSIAYLGSFANLTHGAYFFTNVLDLEDFKNGFPEEIIQIDATGNANDFSSEIGYFDNLFSILPKALAGSGVRYVFLGKNNYRLWPRAFKDARKLRWLDLGGTQEISERCFKNCPRLKIVMGPAVERIDVSAFKNCPKIELLYVPNLQAIDPNSFRNCNIRFVVLPEKLILFLQELNIALNSTLLPAEKYDYLDALYLTNVQYR